MEKRLQMAQDPEDIKVLDNKSTKRIQYIVRNILYYARSFDTTMLQAINEKLWVQSNPTRDTDEKAKLLLDYAATYPNAIIRYKVRNMVLHVDSYLAYLTMSEARSCNDGNFIFELLAITKDDET